MKGEVSMRFRLDIYPDFAVMKNTLGKSKVKGRRKKTETPVQFLTRMIRDFPIFEVYFKRGDVFEKIER
jgi:hypothetical protein